MYPDRWIPIRFFCAIVFFAAITTVQLFAPGGQVFAQTNSPSYAIDYRGVLTQGGVPVTIENATITLAVYDVETGGAHLWTETHANVQVSDGVFNISIGSITPLDLTFDVQYYLGISVQRDSEMVPRIPFGSAAYSQQSMRSMEADYATRAETSNVSTYAERAGTTDTATYADTAGHADTARQARFAEHANTATRAETSEYAANAGYADAAGTAQSAGHAETADHAESATQATYAGHADTATNATNAKHAESATHADTATNATNAGHADTATNATFAKEAEYATNAGHAETATHATSAGKADYASQAGTADVAQSVASGSISTDSLNPNMCLPEQIIKKTIDNAGWECAYNAKEADYAAVADSVLDGAVTPASLDATSCSNNEVLRFVSGSWQCNDLADVASGTTGSAAAAGLASYQNIAIVTLALNDGTPVSGTGVYADPIAAIIDLDNWCPINSGPVFPNTRVCLIKIMPGDYILNGPIDLPEGVDLEGSGERVTRLIVAPLFTSASGAVIHSMYGSSIRDLSVLADYASPGITAIRYGLSGGGNTVGSGLSYPITPGGAPVDSPVEMRNVTIQGGMAGVTAESGNGVSGLTLRSVTIGAEANGVLCDTRITIEDSFISAYGTTGNSYGISTAPGCDVRVENSTISVFQGVTVSNGGGRVVIFNSLLDAPTSGAFENDAFMRISHSEVNAYEVFMQANYGGDTLIFSSQLNSINPSTPPQGSNTRCVYTTINDAPVGNDCLIPSP